MVRQHPTAAKVITSADIVDALIEIRNELAGGLAPVFVIPKIWTLVGRIELDAQTAAEQIAASLPRLCGGAPDDESWEIVDPKSFGDAWPAYPHPEVDGYLYEPTADWTGPTPLGVLQEDAPVWEPTADDLAEMASWSAGLFTEADQLIAHGCV